MELKSPLPPPSFRRRRRRQCSEVGLLSVWICGFLLLGLSLYATTNLTLPPSFSMDDKPDSGPPTVAIFSAPRAFAGSVRARQDLAVRSWLSLSPNIRVVLFGRGHAVASFAAPFGSRVSVEPNIDFTFLGTPFLHSMVARAQASTSDISVLIDPEAVLLPGFISVLNHAFKHLQHNWLLVASPWKVPYFPFHLDETGADELQEFFVRSRQWDHCGKRMLMAWNKVGLPLHIGVLPPFLYGKGLHDEWIVNEAFSFDPRFIFDASRAIPMFRVNDPEHQTISLGSSQKSEGRSWENAINSHLGTVYGSLCVVSEANYSRLVQLVKCGRQYVLVDTEENGIYPFQYESSQGLWEGRIMRFWKERETRACVDGIKSVNRITNCLTKTQLRLPLLPSLPLSLESLLHLVADDNMTIVLAMAGYSYKDMLMSWVCRLRHLLITNFVVCALDHDIYQFSVLQGLPVFKDSLAPNNVSFNNCHFGTECFQRVTKVKSRLVLQILKLGYNVLLSDVDVYWFQNPLPFLSSFGPAILAAQSDEYKETGPINLPRRLNSGFYFARSDASTIKAMEKIVKHAATSNLSEQPSFYDTLCGEGGTHRVGDDRCVEPETNLTVYFLNRDLFPNGAYQGLWEKKDVRAACVKKGCLILHNNWISGRRKKLVRQVLSGLWGYRTSTRMCLQNWHKTDMTPYY